MMRRQSEYTNTNANTNVDAFVHHAPPQSAQFEAFTPERENTFGGWDRDGSKIPTSINPQIFNQGQSGEASRSYFQGHRADQAMSLEKQSNSDTSSQPQIEDGALGFDENAPPPQTYQAVEQKFRDDIMKLFKEQNDFEDAENARHRERINGINGQYEEQLAALRARHANRRDEFLRRESSARQYQQQQQQQQQQQEATADCFGGQNNEPRGGYSEPQRSYNSGEQYESYRERARFLGGPRDHSGFEPRGPYPGGRVFYDTTGSRYY